MFLEQRYRPAGIINTDRDVRSIRRGGVRAVVMGDGRAGIQNSSLISIVNPATKRGDGVRRRNTVNYFRLRENVSPLNPLSLLPLPLSSLSVCPKLFKNASNTTRLESRTNQPLPPRELSQLNSSWKLSIPIRLEERSLETRKSESIGRRAGRVVSQ